MNWKCKKEAVTDALKRALRNFGNLLGNCLYDKSFVNEVIKIKVQPPKFDKSELHRKPEFEEPQPKLSTSASSSTIKSEPQSKPISSVPPHMRPQTSAPRTPHAQPQSSHSTSTRTPPPPYNHPPTQNTAPPPQNASIQRQLPQPQPQSHSNPKPAPQKVTFAEPTVDADESFAFSDDDAFLAVVDMGEGDMGKPIDYDEGIGGVSIDRSASDLSVSIETPSGHPTGTSATHVNPNSGQLHGRQPQSRQSFNPISNQSTPHPQIQKQNDRRQPSTHGPQQGAVQQPTVSRIIPAAIKSNAGPSRTIALQQQYNGQSSSTLSSSNQSEGIRAVQNQNQPPGRLNGISDGRAIIPKLQPMGSFVFPTGVVCVTHGSRGDFI